MNTHKFISRRPQNWGLTGSRGFLLASWRRPLRFPPPAHRASFAWAATNSAHPVASENDQNLAKSGPQETLASPVLTELVCTGKSGGHRHNALHYHGDGGQVR